MQNFLLLFMILILSSINTKTYAGNDIENDNHNNNNYLEQYFLELDINQNGRIDKKDIEKFSKKEFISMDINKDDILSRDEFFEYICKKNCTKKYCDCKNTLKIDDTEYIKEFWDTMDKNKDGKITFEEKLEADIENFFIMDINGDNIISREEVEAQLY